MSACHIGDPIFIMKTAFKDINQAQQNFNLSFLLKCCKVYLKKPQTWLQTHERSKGLSEPTCLLPPPLSLCCVQAFEAMFGAFF